MENNWKDVYIWFLTSPPEMASESLIRTKTALQFRTRKDGKTSGQRTAEAMGISRERVRQILAWAQAKYLEAHPPPGAPVKVSKGERLHRFMLAYQQKHGKPPTMKIIVKEAEIWKSITSVQEWMRVLAKEGVVEKRKAQWWALEECELCGDLTDLLQHLEMCQSCYSLECQ